VPTTALAMRPVSMREATITVDVAEDLRSFIPVRYGTKHLQQGIESGRFRVKKNMLRISGFQTFPTARRTIQGGVIHPPCRRHGGLDHGGFEAMLRLRKGFGFDDAWTVREQNRLLAFYSQFHRSTKSEKRSA
jgi:hypothetical protein